RRVQDRPTYRIRYNLPEDVRAEIRERGSSLDDVFSVDAPIRIARSLVDKMGRGTRQRQLGQVATLVEELQASELTAVAKELDHLGIDWSAPPTGFEGLNPQLLSASLSTNRKDDTVTAGESMTLKVQVTNKGKEPIYRLRGITK